jgi:hypothetical protein
MPLKAIGRTGRREKNSCSACVAQEAKTLTRDHKTCHPLLF